MRLIDVDVITDHEIIDYLGISYASRLDDVRDLLDEQPTIEAIPVVHGEWKYGDWDKGGHWVSGSKKVRCSHCHRVFDSDNLNIWHWCPQCGAKMKGE